MLWRLDGGLDHILVDEAQDTSPAQWAVIERARRRSSRPARGRGPAPRTIFVVGDLKQSIYSFQGADPEGFERMRRHFREELGRIGETLADERLEYSFRSAETVLQRGGRHLRRRGGGLGEARRRATRPSRRRCRAASTSGPSCREVEAAEVEEPDWTAPVDRRDPADAQAGAGRAASPREVAAMVARRDHPGGRADGGWARRPVTRRRRADPRAAARTPCSPR